MAKQEWQFESNQFDNSTKQSNKRMDTVSADTDAKLDARKAEPGINALYLFMHPKRVAFGSKYAAWVATRGIYKGATKAVSLLWDELSNDKIDEWDITIQGIHRKKTAQYTALMPSGRHPFQSGSYESRLTALRAMMISIGDDVALRDLKTDIESFLSRLETTRTLQQGKEGMVAELARQLETERITVAQGMYYVLGGLMQIYYQAPENISAFFDLENIRNTGAEEEEPAEGYVLTIAPAQTLEAGITFDAETIFLFTNAGEVPLDIFTGGDKPEPPSTPFVIKPGEEIEKPVAELGDPANRYLYFRNNNPDLAGSIEIITV